MAQIFRTVSLVLIWLGEYDDTGKLAFGTMRKLVTCILQDPDMPSLLYEGKNKYLILRDVKQGLGPNRFSRYVTFELSDLTEMEIEPFEDVFRNRTW